jgi:hypothetical protein
VFQWKLFEQISQNNAKRHPQNSIPWRYTGDTLEQDNASQGHLVEGCSRARQWRESAQSTSQPIQDYSRRSEALDTRGQSRARLVECRSIFQGVPSFFSSHEVSGELLMGVLSTARAFWLPDLRSAEALMSRLEGWHCSGLCPDCGHNPAAGQLPARSPGCPFWL